MLLRCNLCLQPGNARLRGLQLRTRPAQVKVRSAARLQTPLDQLPGVALVLLCRLGQLQARLRAPQLHVGVCHLRSNHDLQRLQVGL